MLDRLLDHFATLDGARWADLIVNAILIVAAVMLWIQDHELERRIRKLERRVGDLEEASQEDLPWEAKGDA